MVICPCTELRIGRNMTTFLNQAIFYADEKIFTEVVT